MSMQSLGVAQAAAMTVTRVLEAVESTPEGLSAAEARDRLRSLGPNAVRSHQARALPLLVRQLRSPLLVLLLITATASGFVGERNDAVIIGVIILTSVGLGFGNEYRAERAAQALHDQLRHHCVVHRGGRQVTVDVIDLVPGDVLDLHLGQLVPADLRLTDVQWLQCEESVLT